MARERDFAAVSDNPDRDSELGAAITLGAGAAAEIDGLRNNVVRDEGAAVTVPVVRLEEDRGTSFTADVLIEPAFEA